YSVVKERRFRFCRGNLGKFISTTNAWYHVFLFSSSIRLTYSGDAQSGVRHLESCSYWPKLHQFSGELLPSNLRRASLAGSKLGSKLEASTMHARASERCPNPSWHKARL